MGKAGRSIMVGDMMLHFTSDKYDGKLYDTKVGITRGEISILLCWISGCDIENFIRDFKSLIENYKI